ncbi:methylated-DNA--[protein]-cysteine S-methyltransferase [Paenibacillus fonticola]|uniref:methylated-DNA--[protein]-cysteine S-methyltransferase n=1 Tax=Paenibacillus fonticola TaxID=379896 RepID=UPI000369FD44|nr:methylated-DNA--[protein]-cysteine S-methyltransferase [Paenibacillus fonticola]
MTKTSTESPLYWSLLQMDRWSIHLAATTRGLCYVGSHGQPFAELLAWANRRFPGSPLVEDEARIRPYSEQLNRYLRGQLECFNLPMDAPGTAFQREVWQALVEIPYGRTESYSDIAFKISKPSAVRAVGAAIGANPLLIIIPCHRVIGKNGALTGYRGGLDMKARLMELEQDYGKKEKVIHEAF